MVDRLFIGGEHCGAIAFDVEYLHRTPITAGKFERRRRQVGNGRRLTDADLDEPFDIDLGTEQQVLRFDPADRAGELPGEQLDEHRAAQFAGLGRPYVEVCEDRVEWFRWHEISNFLDKLTLERERLGHEVRNVPTGQDLRIDRDRQQLFETIAEIGDSSAQDG